MKSGSYIHSSSTVDKVELQKSLNDLQNEETRLKQVIKEIKELDDFNSLEYYEENLEIIKILIGDVKYRIGKCTEH